MARDFKIFMHFTNVSGCEMYRVFLPIRHCRDDLKKEGIQLDLGMEVENDLQYDSYIFQRCIDADVYPTLLAIKRKGKTLAWGLDDNLFEIPSSNPASKVFQNSQRNNLIGYLSISDLFTMSTLLLAEQLIETYGVDPNRTIVTPNLVDIADYPESNRDCPKPFKRILWAGSPTHGDDLKLVADLLRKLVLSRDDLQLCFIGMMPDEMKDLGPEKCVYFYGCELKSYWRMLCMTESDVSLAPLVSRRFNHAKSAIKWMESTLAGSVVVASDTPPYSDVIEHGQTGFLVPEVKGEPEKWTEQILEALEPGNAWVKQKAREKVIADHSWRDGGEGKEKWMNLFRCLRDMPRPTMVRQS